MKTQFTLLRAFTAAELENLVNERLAKGWKLAGNFVYVAGRTASDMPLFLQGVIYEAPAA